MCIRDRLDGGRVRNIGRGFLRNRRIGEIRTLGQGRIGRDADGGSAGGLAQTGRGNGVLQRNAPGPVSYTHLDVYKRQPLSTRQHTRNPLLWLKVLEHVGKMNAPAPVSYTHLDVYKRQGRR